MARGAGVAERESLVVVSEPKLSRSQSSTRLRPPLDSGLSALPQVSIAFASLTASTSLFATKAGSRAFRRCAKDLRVSAGALEFRATRGSVPASQVFVSVTSAIIFFFRIEPRGILGRRSPGAERFVAWAELALAHADGSYAKLLARLAKADVLVLDDLGLGPPSEAQRHDLLEVMEDRYGRRSPVVTSQLPLPNWHEWLANCYDDRTLPGEPLCGVEESLEGLRYLIVGAGLPPCVTPSSIRAQRLPRPSDETSYRRTNRSSSSRGCLRRRDRPYGTRVERVSDPRVQTRAPPRAASRAPS